MTPAAFAYSSEGVLFMDLLTFAFKYNHDWRISNHDNDIRLQVRGYFAGKILPVAPAVEG